MVCGRSASRRASSCSSSLVLPYAASTRIVRDRIAHEMSDWSGLEVSIGATPEISIWPTFQAILTDVTLSLPGKAPAIDGRARRDRAVGACRTQRRCRILHRAADPADAPRRGHDRAGDAAPALPDGGRIARSIETARADRRGKPRRARHRDAAGGRVRRRGVLGRQGRRRVSAAPRRRSSPASPARWIGPT